MGLELSEKQKEQKAKLESKLARLWPRLVKRRITLQDFNGKSYTFKSSKPRYADLAPIRFRKLREPERLRVMPRFPELDFEEKPNPDDPENPIIVPVPLTLEKQAQYFEVCCAILAITSVDEVPLEDFKNCENELVQEMAYFVMHNSGMTVEAGDEIEGFRGVSRGIQPRNDVLRVSREIP